MALTHHQPAVPCRAQKSRRPIKGPTSRGEKLRENKCMAKLNDALCMVRWSLTNVCLIWVLTDSGKGKWAKVYTIAMAPSIDSSRPLAIVHHGRKLLFYTCNRLKATPTLQIYDPLTETCTHLRQFTSNLLGNSGLCVLHLECFVSPKNLPISAPSALYRQQWLRRLNPVSFFYK
jgi:hypothetical protein